MQRKDFERAYKLRKRIIELEIVSREGISISETELKRLRAEFDKLRKRFDAIADDLPCDIYMILEIHYMCAWSYNMMKRYLLWPNETCKGNPKKIIEEYFSKTERKKRSI